MLIPDPETSGEETKVRTQISKSSRFPLESHDTVSPTRSSIRFSLSSYISIDRFLPFTNDSRSRRLFPHHKHTYWCACVPGVTKPSSQTTYPRLYTSPFSHRKAATTHDHKSRLTRKLRLLRHHETKRYTKERVDG